MGPFSECGVRLHRDALSTQWGFRMQGGKDFKTPLTIQRVFVGSPAEGELHRGDVLLAIDNYDTSYMTHKEAQDLIKRSGGSISLRLKRSVQVRAQSAPAPQLQHKKSQDYRAPGLSNFPSAPQPSAGPMSYGYTPKKMGRPLGGGGLNFGTDYNRPHYAPQMVQTVPAPPAPQQHHAAPHPGSMLSKVNETLSQAIWAGGPPPGGEADDYEQKSVHDLQQMFTPAQRAAQAMGSHHHRPVHQPHRQVSFRTDVNVAEMPSGLREPGWSPKSTPHHTYSPVRSPAAAFSPQSHHAPAPAAPMSPQSHPEPPQFSPQPHTQPSAPQFNAHDHPPQPTGVGGKKRHAWSGSLKSSGGPRPWEIGEQPAEHAPTHTYVPGAGQVHTPRVQNAHYGPGGGAPQYQQVADQEASDTAQVKHLQYNTPIGLYSQKNIQEVLHGQTAGRPGEGTLKMTGTGPSGGSTGPKKTFNPATSDVLRLVAEEDERRKMGGGGGHHHHQQHHPQQQHHQQQQQHSPHHHQPHHEPYADIRSPSMQALESHYGGGMEMGTSDF